MKSVATDMFGCPNRTARAPSFLLALACCACGDGPARKQAGGRATPTAPASKAPTAPSASAAASAPPVRLFASQFVVNVRVTPAKEAFRLGYLRGGAVVQATTAEPVGHDKCRKGWYPLAGGGFVCSTVDAIPFVGKRLPERQPLQADLTALLPYPYGYSRRRGTPVYKRIPNADDVAQHEELAPPGSPTGVDPNAAAGIADPPPSPTPPPDPSPLVGLPAGAASDAGVPTLASLLGEEGSVLLRRMERGFYVSLDRELRRGGRGYYRTQSSGFIPSERLALVKPNEFSGVALGQGSELPIGFVMSSKYLAQALDAKGRLRSAGKPGYHHVFRVTAETELRGKRYFVGEDGRHYRTSDVARVARRDKPQEVAADEKWIDVDLGAQSLVAYVGDQPVYATLISSGRVKDELDPQKSFATPTGSYRITSKHVTATMDGDHALDGPYSIEDVPYVMYFELAYALHAAFWHNGFGRPRSHGCINLAPADARWLFEFAAPVLPPKWHGVYPTKEAPGTRLYIRGETPEG